MDNGSALLRAICRESDEDTPRLMFADWCDENGQPERAEFIRLQILLHNTSFIRQGGRNAKWPEPWLGRQRRVLELLRRYNREWSGSVGRMWSHMPLWTFSEGYARGFLERVTFPKGRFLADAAEVFGENPIRHAKVDGRFPKWSGDHANSRHWWERKEGDSFADWEVPAEIFDRLSQPAEGYKHSYLATDALSAALVAVGRELAGLYELTPSFNPSAPADPAQNSTNPC